MKMTTSRAEAPREINLMYGLLKTPVIALFVANEAKKLILMPKVNEPRASEPTAN